MVASSQEAIMGRAALGIILSLFCTLGQAANFSDIWWNPSESGWGVTIADHGSNLFGVWYTYRADGKPVWYTIPGGTFSSDHSTFTGDVYVTRGPSYTLSAFDASQVVATKVGTATFNFAPSGEAAGVALFTYNVNGVAKSERIQRQSFGNASAQWGIDFTDLWFNPAESGWGLSLAQHGNNVFAVWYTYDTDGQPLWLVMPGVQFTSAVAFNGKLYTTTGPYYGASTFDASSVKLSEAGTAAISVNIGASAAGACDAGSASFAPMLNTPSGMVQYQRTACTQAFGNMRASAGTLALQPKTCKGTYTISLTEPGGCMGQGTPHTYSGGVTLTGVDWTRAGHQSGSLTLTNLPYFIPMDDGMMMGEMMMEMGMTSGNCISQTLPAVTLPLDFTLANALTGLSTSGSSANDAGQLSYSIAATDTSVSGQVGFTGGAWFTQAFTAKGSFSCATQ
jgi:hypothetical protein